MRAAGPSVESARALPIGLAKDAEGSWFRGGIFAEKCDLSPDGELFVYAAYKGIDESGHVDDRPRKSG